MKKILIILFIVGQYNLNLYGQTGENEFKDIATSIEYLVPENWRVLKQSVGDINRDEKEDICIVVEEVDSSKYEINEGLGMDTINLNPRILLIYFGNDNGKYEKELQLDEFIILQDPTMDEPLRNLTITKEGLLEIEFFLWYSAGSWTISNQTYQFKFQNNQFELIHYEYSSMYRGSGEGTYYDVDFEKKRMKIIESTIDDDTEKEKTKKKCKRFKLEKLKTLRALKQPFEWEFNGLYI